MICPNCGLDQAEGPSCINCRATLPRPLSASEIKTMKAGFERKEKTVPPPSKAEPIEFNLKNLETSGKKLETSAKNLETSGKNLETGTKDLGASSPGPVKSPTTQGIEQFQKVLVTTSSAVEGKKVVRYGGIVGCQVVVKLYGLDEFVADIKDVSSLRGSSYGDLFKKAEVLLMSDLKIEAAKKEANAVIGISIHYESGWKNAMIVRASGTAVYLEDA